MPFVWLLLLLTCAGMNCGTELWDTYLPPTSSHVTSDVCLIKWAGHVHFWEAGSNPLSSVRAHVCLLNGACELFHSAAHGRRKTSTINKCHSSHTSVSQQRGHIWRQMLHNRSYSARRHVFSVQTQPATTKAHQILLSVLPEGRPSQIPASTHPGQPGQLG